MDYSTWQTISGTAGLIIFVVLFAGVLVYALWPSNKSTFDRAARLPLDDDPDSETLRRGGCCG
jgi:cytochrome c oxidase cbb3-type subunit 4